MRDLNGSFEGSVEACKLASLQASKVGSYQDSKLASKNVLKKQTLFVHCEFVDYRYNTPPPPRKLPS